VSELADMRTFSTVLVTGGAGFIGSHLVRRLISKYPEMTVVNLDALTYAGNLASLRDLEGEERHVFVRGDIRDRELVRRVFEEHRPEAVVHLAAESHVDRSISGPMAFLETNILGTASLLEAAREAWKPGEGLFHHVSTDEVFGSLGDEGLFSETTAYDPRSPYSASKASSDHLVRAWHHTYGLPVVVTNCSNNYGAYQFPEKLIPLMIRNIRDNRPLPVYGEGKNVRDWLWVEDHVAALDVVLHGGSSGATYAIGGLNAWRNIDLVHLLIRLTDAQLGRPEGASLGLISYVKDRAGHDLRYAIDASHIAQELGWKPSIRFEEGLAATVAWYLGNGEWLDSVTSGAYLSYYEAQYQHR
jgi:dTDP-glucose 4,6-dehydratase